MLSTAGSQRATMTSVCASSRALAERGRAVTPHALTRDLCLGWDELRVLARHPLATIGAHTMTHPRLARLARARPLAEMAESRARLRDELGVAAAHFCYPYGGRAAAGEREFALAADARL